MSVGRSRMDVRAQVVRAQKELLQEQAARQKRQGAWGVEVATVIADRETQVARLNAQAGAALAKMLEDGLDIEEAVAWTGAAVTVREARALIAAAHEAEATTMMRSAGSETGSSAPAG